MLFKFLLNSWLTQCIICSRIFVLILEFFNHQKRILQIALRSWMTSLRNRNEFFFFDKGTVKSPARVLAEFSLCFSFALRRKPVSTISVPAEKPDPGGTCACKSHSLKTRIIRINNGP